MVARCASTPSTRARVSLGLSVALVTPGGLAQRGGMGSASRVLVDASRGHGLNWRVLDPWRGPFRLFQLGATAAALGRLVGLALRRRVDVVHVNMAAGGSLAREGLFVLAARALRRPCIVHLHGSRLDHTYARLPRPLRAAFRALLRSADAVVTLGSAWRHFALDVLGLEWERVHAIANGVPEPTPVDRPGPGSPVRILFVGRLGERKGSATLLEAVSRPELHGLDWTLTLAGDGELATAERLAGALGVGDRCACVGWLDATDVARLMAGSDILVLPSRHEGLPMAVLEAMAHGLAVVTTRAGALADAIVPDETGLVVAADAPRELAAALRRLVERPELRWRLGAAARQRYLDQFTDTRMAGAFALLYAETVARHAAERAFASRPGLPRGGRAAAALARPQQIG